MKRTIFLACVLLFAVQTFAPRKRPDFKLPPGATLIETKSLKPNRVLILWMVKAEKYPRGFPREGYTCPEETRGSFYRGATRVSLVDTVAHRIINTVELREEGYENVDQFDIPYRIHAGSYYHVAGVPEGREGKPTIMWLRDYNGDGQASEFALFDALACMGLQTTLIGYSERQDKVIQYQVQLELEAQGKRSTDIQRWTDYLFSKTPQSAGYWKYEIDYRGRGGLLDKYEIRYNRQAERFEGKAVFTEN